MEMTQKLWRRPEEVDEVASEVAVEGLAWEVQAMATFTKAEVGVDEVATKG